MSAQTEPRVPLPKSWNKHVRSSLLHVISLAQFAVARRGGTVDSYAEKRMHPKIGRTHPPRRLSS